MQKHMSIDHLFREKKALLFWLKYYTNHYFQNTVFPCKSSVKMIVSNFVIKVKKLMFLPNYRVIQCSGPGIDG